MEFIRYYTMTASIALAKNRGPFPAIQGSIYDPQNILWQPPLPITEYSCEWNRPFLDWEKVIKGICEFGIRNAAQTTIAPTGTIATVAGCEGYGCEPVFALAYIRHVNDNGKDLQLSYTSPFFEKKMAEAGINDKGLKQIIARVMENGTCQGIDEIPENIQQVFVVSQDVSSEEHVRMQAALQQFVDNSLSKTINFPENATELDIAIAYELAWELGCKGITVYVTGSRQKVVLETRATLQKKQDVVEPSVPISEGMKQINIWHDKKKPRPNRLPGITISVGTPLGKAFVTINENGGHQPFEVFVNTAKAGSDTAAVSEAIGRLISYTLRIASSVAPRERLKEIFRQLSGIGGGRSLGFGPNRVRSLPDGVAQALAEYLENTEQLQERSDDSFIPGGNGYNLIEELAKSEALDDENFQTDFRNPIGDLCPECGHASYINEEGCRKCYSCGYSEC